MVLAMRRILKEYPEVSRDGDKSFFGVGGVEVEENDTIGEIASSMTSTSMAHEDNVDWFLVGWWRRESGLEGELGGSCLDGD